MTTHMPEADRGEYRGASPPPNPPPPVGERHWIERPADLAAMAHVLNAAPSLAIDVEFVSGNSRSSKESLPPRLALIQIADGAQPHCYVVDALRLVDLSPLTVPFENPAIVKIFHGVGSDLRVLAARNLRVMHTLDIEAVSRTIFGSRESSLQTMLQRACGVRMDKSLQRSDWTQRPLPTAMFAYAARDAEMTLALAQWLREHYRWATDLYEEAPSDPTPEDLVAPWLGAFIEGERTFPPELTEDAEQSALAADCLAALARLTKPSWRARVFRAAADLALTEITPQVMLALQSPTGEERAAAARALGRLRAAQARDLLLVACDDVNFDVRRAAVAALDQIDLPPRIGRFARPDLTEAEPPAEPDMDAPWKTLLRGMLPEDEG